MDTDDRIRRLDERIRSIDRCILFIDIYLGTSIGILVALLACVLFL